MGLPRKGHGMILVLFVQISCQLAEAYDKQQYELSFQDNMYAQLLMRAVTGTLYPSNSIGWRSEEGFPPHPYDFEKRRMGQDWPSVGHTMVGWVRLENIYNLLLKIWQENVPGDFVELGVWRGGASIFAAGIIKQFSFGREVWVCDSFAGFDANPWDGDKTWASLNDVIAVSADDVRNNFAHYGLLDPNVHFVEGFFKDSLPRTNFSEIAILRLDADLYSSTADILYNLYDKVAISGYIVVDDWSIPQCRQAVSDFRTEHQIDEEIIDIDGTGMFWKKSKHVSVKWNVYERISGVTVSDRIRRSQPFLTHPSGPTKQIQRLPDALLAAREEYFYLSKVSSTPLGGSSNIIQYPWFRTDDDLITNNAHINEDIRSHLPTIFSFTMFFDPKSIVELGVRSGWSTRAFSAASRILRSKMLGVDIDPNCETIYERAKLDGKGFFLAGDAAECAHEFKSWAVSRDFPDTVDLLFIDTSHIYNDTVRELQAWAPHLSDRAAIILHDSNLQPSYTLKDGSRGRGWDNDRGVARALQEFAGVEFDETNWFDSGAEAVASGWRVIHDPTSCGLTILVRKSRIAGRKETGLRLAAKVQAQTAGRVVSDAMWRVKNYTCDGKRQQCVTNPSSERFVGVSCVVVESIDSASWRSGFVPMPQDLAAGIWHASQASMEQQDDSTTFAGIPAFLISNPLHSERRKYMDFILRSAGFSNITFPQYVGSEDIDFDQLLRSGRLSKANIKVMLETEWIGTKWKKVVSLIANHMEALRLGIETQSNLFGIFEDDLMLLASPEAVQRRIAGALSELPKSADILYLEYCFETCLQLNCSTSFGFIARAVKPACTAAMIFTQKGAKKAIQALHKIFWALDNMYAQLIVYGDLEAYVMRPPVLAQDAYFSQNDKFGERGVKGRSHRPFSIICVDPENQWELMTMQIVSQEMSGPFYSKLPSTPLRITVLSSDSFFHCKWRNLMDDSTLILEYYSQPCEEHDRKPEYLGRLSIAEIGNPILLSLSHEYFCDVKDPVFSLKVMLKSADGANLAQHTVNLPMRSFYQHSSIHIPLICFLEREDSSGQILEGPLFADCRQGESLQTCYFRSSFPARNTDYFMFLGTRNVHPRCSMNPLGLYEDLRSMNLNFGMLGIYDLSQNLIQVSLDFGMSTMYIMSQSHLTTIFSGTVINPSLSLSQCFPALRDYTMEITSKFKNVTWYSTPFKCNTGAALPERVATRFVTIETRADGSRWALFRPEMALVPDILMMVAAPDLLKENTSSNQTAAVNSKAENMTAHEGSADVDTRYHAYVLNVPGAQMRWQRIVNILDEWKFINPIRWPTVSLEDERVTTYVPKLTEIWQKQVYSNLLSFRDAWEHFANSSSTASSLEDHQIEDEWALFFEDHVSLHPEACQLPPSQLKEAIDAGFDVAQDDGFLYLGICNGVAKSEGWVDACCKDLDLHRLGIACSEMRMHGLAYQRACGSCLHAFALTRKRARTLFEELVPGPNYYGHPESVYLDFHTSRWNNPEFRKPDKPNLPLWLVGSNLRSPFNPTHFGLFYQDWDVLKIPYPQSIFESRQQESLLENP